MINSIVLPRLNRGIKIEIKLLSPNTCESSVIQRYLLRINKHTRSLNPWSMYRSSYLDRYIWIALLFQNLFHGKRYARGCAKHEIEGETNVQRTEGTEVGEQRKRRNNRQSEQWKRHRDVENRSEGRKCSGRNSGKREKEEKRGEKEKGCGKSNENRRTERDEQWERVGKSPHLHSK